MFHYIYVLLSVASQINQITNNMVIQTKKQGEDLDIIEQDVADVHENVVKADKEIKQAEREERKYGCKLVLLIFFILIIIAMIIVIIILANK